MRKKKAPRIVQLRHKLNDYVIFANEQFAKMGFLHCGTFNGNYKLLVISDPALADIVATRLGATDLSLVDCNMPPFTI